MRPALPSLRILTAVSVALARVERTLMPGYFFSKAAVTGRTSWLMIWVEYQTTSPSRFAAAINVASAALATLQATPAANATAAVDIKRANDPLMARLAIVRRALYLNSRCGRS